MMNQEKIQELVNRSQQNDKRAFALLVSEYDSLSGYFVMKMKPEI